MLNFWWLADLVNGLEARLPPLSSQKKLNAHLWITFNSWWLARLVDGLKSCLPPLSSQKDEMLIFGLCSTSDDRPGWSMDLKPHPPPLSSQKNEMLIFGLHLTSYDLPGWSKESNPVHHASPTKKMKCSFLDYVQLLMTGRAGWWTQTPSATPLQPKRWNAHFWITFNFWWSAGLVNGLEPHPAPLSSHKNEMLIFGLCSTSDDLPGWSMDSNPICHPSPAKKWNARFWIMFNFWWSAEQSKQKMSTEMQKNEKGPLSHQKIKCSFLDYIQLLMIGRGIWAKNVNQNAKKWKRPPKSSKNKMFIFGLCSTPDDWRSWSMDSNPVCHPSPAKKMKCLFLDYVHLLMIGQAGRWTWTPSATPLQPKKWNARFWIMFNFWWSTKRSKQKISTEM